MKLLIKIGVGVSVALNLFVFTVSMYGLMTQDKRIEENRKWLKETIEKEVYDQIKFVMLNNQVVLSNDNPTHSCKKSRYSKYLSTRLDESSTKC